MKIQCVQGQWQEFIAACDPRKQFHDKQQREMRRAFLSGFYCALQTALQVAELSRDDGATIMQRLYEECETSIKGMIRDDFNRISKDN